MDAIIEHTLSKWPKFQVIAATKRRNMKYTHLEPVQNSQRKSQYLYP